jgi:hypothetical protein
MLTGREGTRRTTILIMINGDITLIHSSITTITLIMTIRTSLTSTIKDITTINRVTQLQNPTIKITIKLIDNITRMKAQQDTQLTKGVNGHRNHPKAIGRLAIKCHINQENIWESTLEISDKMLQSTFGPIETPTWQDTSPTINHHLDLLNPSKSTSSKLNK